MVFLVMFSIITLASFYNKFYFFILFYLIESIILYDMVHVVNLAKKFIP